MLKKKYRLPSSLKLRKAQTISSHYFILKTAGSELLYPRFAFVISKKVDSRAVVRNKIKRIMTTFLSRAVDKIAHQDMIFILKREAAENMEKLSQDLESFVSKEGLLK